MNYEQFAIWLHGFLEISNAEIIDQNQTQIIKDHLALLFEKRTPDRSEEEFFNDPTRYPRHYPVAPSISDAFKITCDVDLNTKFDTELHKNKTYC